MNASKTKLPEMGLVRLENDNGKRVGFNGFAN